MSKVQKHKYIVYTFKKVNDTIEPVCLTGSNGDKEVDTLKLLSSGFPFYKQAVAKDVYSFSCCISPKNFDLTHSSSLKKLSKTKIQEWVSNQLALLHLKQLRE